MRAFATLVLAVALAAAWAWFAIGPGAGAPVGGCSAAEDSPLATSPPGRDEAAISWLASSGITAAPDFDEEQILDVVAFRDRFVAVGRRANGPHATALLLVSSDGEAWTAAERTPDLRGVELAKVAVGGDRAFAIGTAARGDRGGSRAVVWTSHDGTRWSEAHGPFEERVPHALAAGDRGLLLLGGDPATGRPVAWRSGDGVRWEEVAIRLPAPHEYVSFADLAWTGSAWLAAGSLSRGPDAASAAVVWQSSDGRAWSCQVLPAFSDLRTWALSLHTSGTGDRWLVVGGGSRGCGFGASCPGFQVTWSGAPGHGWSDIVAPGAAFDAVGPSPVLSSASYAGIADGFVASGGGTWTSTDGLSWRRLEEAGPAPLSGSASAVAAMGPKVVVADMRFDAAGQDVDAWLTVGELEP